MSMGNSISNVILFLSLVSASIAHCADLAPLRSVHLRWGSDAADKDAANKKEANDVPDFVRHIQPLLGKAGCSNRACHGSFQGKGGFRLSLFGSDPKLDHENLNQPSRIDSKSPDESLVILKPTQRVDHEGGERFQHGSWQHRMLRSWIEAGAVYHSERQPIAVRLMISTSMVHFSKVGERKRLTAVARFSDGSSEDVTGLTQFSSNDDRVAAVDEMGELAARAPGDTAVVASYGGEVVSVPVVVAYDHGPYDPETFPQRNRIDAFIAARLMQLRLPASQLSSDEEFLRRVSLDMTGTLPTPDEIRHFVSDTSTGKRSRKIDELLERPTYALLWSTRFCDVTGLNAPLFLGNTDFGPLVGDMWFQWIERRFRENTPYDQIVAGMLTANSRGASESYEEYSARMSSYVKTKGASDFSAQMDMPHFWFRENLKTAEEKGLGVAYSFLGVRMECAQCHRHPFDRWTQLDFQQFAAVFSRIQKGVPPESQAAYDKIKGKFDAETLRTAATRRQTYWKLAREGETVPWPEVFVMGPSEPPTRSDTPSSVARLLGSEAFNVQTDADPRARLMEWLRSPDNRFFSPAFVNRIWTQYFGRGLVNPPDDFSQANSPTHPELLDYLSRGFVDSGFDMKWLHREITNSGTYQLTWRPLPQNRTDERNYSHALIRRLPAEVVVDALQLATSGAAEMAVLATSRKDRRIGVQATADLRRTEYGLAVFGKPLRTVNCDCEREMSPSLLQSVYLRNDPDVEKMLDRPGGWIRKIESMPATELGVLIEEAYLRVVSRLPDEQERIRCEAYLRESNSLAQGLRDLIWALINTQEFVTNH